MFGNGKKNGNAKAAGGALIELREVRKVYDTGAVKVEALRGVDLAVAENEFLAIVGPSGSGKSTLMNIVGCLDTATGGSYRLRGEEVAGLSIDRLADIRNRRVGFVFQNFNLLPQLTAFENVEMPLLFKGSPARERRERVEHLFEQVGIADRMRHRPTELSGGQMQRVAIARALVHSPELLLADEPTGNLDTASGEQVLALLRESAAKFGTTVLMATHSEEAAAIAGARVHLRDGRIQSIE